MSIRKWINLCEAHELNEAQTPHLPRKFWLNPTTNELDACDDHASAVLDMNLPGMEEWKEHLSQYAGEDEDEDYEDALDENQSGLLELAMKNGWVRGGYESEVWGPFLQSDNMSVVRGAVKYIVDMYPDVVKNGIIVGHEEHGVHLQPNEIEPFIRRGKLPES